jgi:hypothetical protein
MNKPTGQLIQLSKWRESEPEDGGSIQIKLPLGALPSDQLEALTMTDGVREWKVRKGDLAILYITNDIKKGDVVGIRANDKETCMVGIFNSDECYYYLEATRELDEHMFHRAHSQVIGRIVEVRRNGKLIETTLPLRPVREMAKVYQFKQRA